MSNKNKEYLDSDFEEGNNIGDDFPEVNKEPDDKKVDYDYDFLEKDDELINHREIMHPDSKIKNQDIILDKKDNLLNKIFNIKRKKEKEVSPDDKILNENNEEDNSIVGRNKKIFSYLLIFIALILLVSISYQLVFKKDNAKDTNNDNNTSISENSGNEFNVGFLDNSNENVVNDNSNTNVDTNNGVPVEKKYNPVYIFTYLPDLFLTKLYDIDELSFEAKDKYFENFLNKDGFAKILEKNIESKNEVLAQFKEERNMFESHNHLDIYYSVHNIILESINRDDNLYKITHNNLGRDLITPTVDKSLEKEINYYLEYNEYIKDFLDKNSISYYNGEEPVYPIYSKKIKKLLFQVNKYIN